MSVDVSEWSARKKLKHSLLRRAFDEGRGSEVILLIQWRLAYERHKNAEGVETAREFEKDNAGQPRALRALNLLSKKLGLNTIYKDTVPAQEEKKQLPVHEYLEAQKSEGIYPPSQSITVSEIFAPLSRDETIAHLCHKNGRLDVSKPILMPIATLAMMPVASNDLYALATEEEIRHIIKHTEYDDNEEGMTEWEFIDQAVSGSMDAPPITDDDNFETDAPKLAMN